MWRLFKQYLEKTQDSQNTTIVNNPFTITAGRILSPQDIMRKHLQASCLGSRPWSAQGAREEEERSACVVSEEGWMDVRMKIHTNMNKFRKIGLMHEAVHQMRRHFLKSHLLSPSLKKSQYILDSILILT